MAWEVYRACFPDAERNAMKKQLVINTLFFEVHTEVYDEYVDMELSDGCFTLDRKSSVLTMMDFHADSAEQSVTLEGGQMAKLLRYIVHTLEIFMWEQEYSLLKDEDAFLDDFFAGEVFYEDESEERGENHKKGTESRPSWCVRVEYSNHTVQDTCSYDDYLPERPEELYFLLLEYFESMGEL